MTNDVNSGNCNTGNCNTGNCNTGNCNSGCGNSGYCNTGKRRDTLENKKSPEEKISPGLLIYSEEELQKAIINASITALKVQD